MYDNLQQYGNPGEMLVGPAKVLLMDEISTGLDSSTTFQIVYSIKRYVNSLDGTAVISLLQTTPETYDLLMTFFCSPMGKSCTKEPVNKFLNFLNIWALSVPKGKE